MYRRKIYFKKDRFERELNKQNIKIEKVLKREGEKGEGATLRYYLKR